ncbi:MAG: class I SAM-dependent methyltransferase [Armatimonadota bacterium]
MAVKTYEQNGLMPAQAAVAGLVKPGSRVLEVGCATGYMTRVLKEDRGCKVTVLEISEDMIERARPYAECAIVGDITNPGIWDDLQRPFDHIVFADVLEHLPDPWAVLRRARECLTPVGSVVCSVPNIAHYRIRLKLLFGHFDYRRYGILDDTHLRFFTAHSIRSTFVDTGYVIESMNGMNWRPFETQMLHLFPNAFAVQFVVEAVAAPKKSDYEEA